MKPINYIKSNINKIRQIDRRHSGGANRRWILNVCIYIYFNKLRSLELFVVALVLSLQLIAVGQWGGWYIDVLAKFGSNFYLCQWFLFLLLVCVCTYDLLFDFFHSALHSRIFMRLMLIYWSDVSRWRRCSENVHFVFSFLFFNY